MTNVRYTYVQDKKNPKRVLTIARTITEDDQVEFGFSLNNVVNTHSPYKYHSEGDVFTKQRGRAIASGRMGKKPFAVPRSSRPPIVDVLEFLAGLPPDVVPHTVKRLAGQALCSP